MKNILVCGRAGVGKDTFAGRVCKWYGYTSFAFADGIYAIAKEYFGMGKKNRKLLQLIGEKLREIDPYVWINYTFNNVKALGLPAVISDCRKIEEYERGVQEGFVPVKIVCDKEIAIERIVKRDGHCDVGLLDAPVETGADSLNIYTIVNNGTLEEFEKEIDRFVELYCYC